MSNTLGWTVSQWRQHWLDNPQEAATTLRELQKTLLEEQAAEWIHLADLPQIERQIDALLAGSAEDKPLFGVPFAVKDNIDVAGMPTTAACPAYAYTASEDAFVVAALKQAGAICVGKTNLDQFATGLNGTRTPYAVPTSAFDAKHISGGSSSGSAVAVGKGIVPFSLGTDTAGSGRVPAGFNNIVGLKPTKGLISTAAVIPACRTLDCVSIFALTVADAEAVLSVAGLYDADDPYARMPPTNPSASVSTTPRLATFAHLDWFGDDTQKTAFKRWRQTVEDAGIPVTEIDPAPFYALADLLYGGPWVAERLAAVEEFFASHADDMDPTVRGIVAGGTDYTALDTFKSEYQRAEFARKLNRILADFDALIVPTSPHFPTLEDLAAEPVLRNTELGRYTNFVNLADLSALAIPATMREDGLPFGVTLIAPAWQDRKLAKIAQNLMVRAERAGITPPTLGATKMRWQQPAILPSDTPDSDEIEIMVVGAHLTGMPLNHQLTDRGGRLLQQTQTAPNYRLFAIAGTVPPKPGLVYDTAGRAIVVETWALPRTALADFLAEIPSPLGLGKVTLADGREVTGFICEPRAVSGARDISSYGGWRAYINDMKSKASTEGETSHV